MNSNWYQLRWVVLNRDNFTCQYCGRKAPDVMLQVDHKVSRADGGSDELNNLVTACIACNIGKGQESLGIPRDDDYNQRRTSKDANNRMGKSVMNYLRTSPEGATGTQIARALGYDRANVARILSTSPLLKKRREKNSVYYLFV